MREILFRGQTRKFGEKVRVGDGAPVPSNWVYGGVLQGEGDFSIIYAVDEAGHFDGKYTVYSDTLGQYTGLKDKNGTRIFDGDILTGESFDKEIFVVKLGKYNQVNSVELTHVGFFAEFYNEPVCGMLRKDLGWWASKCEVIGNIHDNRELLEVK